MDHFSSASIFLRNPFKYDGNNETTHTYCQSREQKKNTNAQKQFYIILFILTFAMDERYFLVCTWCRCVSVCVFSVKKTNLKQNS